MIQRRLACKLGARSRDNALILYLGRDLRRRGMELELRTGNGFTRFRNELLGRLDMLVWVLVLWDFYGLGVRLRCEALWRVVVLL